MALRKNKCAYFVVKNKRIATYITVFINAFSSYNCALNVSCDANHPRHSVANGQSIRQNETSDPGIQYGSIVYDKTAGQTSYNC